jgi:ATP-dependent protease ClpP protease subunit
MRLLIDPLAARAIAPAKQYRSPLIVGGELLLYGDVGDMWGDGSGFTSKAVIQALDEFDGDVTVRINSPGGFVDDGTAIYNALAGYKKGAVTTVVDGFALSAASLIMLGAPKANRKVGRGAMVMIHEPAAFAIGSAADMEKTAEVLNKMADNFASIYAAATGGKAADMRQLMIDETWFGPDEAVESGFAAAVLDPPIESDATASLGIPKFDYDLFYTRAPAAVRAAQRSLPPDIRTAITQGKTPMNAVVTPAVPAASPAAAAPAPADAAAVSDILNRAAAVGLSAAEAAEIITASGADVARAGELIAAKRGARDPDFGRPVIVGHDAGGDEAGFNEAVVDFVQAKLQGRPATKAGAAFNGMTMLDVSKEFLKAHSLPVRARDPASVFGAAFGARPTPRMFGGGFTTTSDLGSLLGDGMNRELARLYQAAEPGSTAIAGVGQVNDYRAKTIVTTTSFPSLEKVLESGEITWSSISDNGETLKIANYARAVAVSIEVLTNDDLGGVQRALRDISIATQNLRAKLVIDALTTTVMSDGYALIDDAHHANVVNGSAPSVTDLSAMRAKMRLQTAPDGTVLGLTPRTILVPAALETLAQQVVAQITANSTEAVNPFSGLTVAVDPRLDAISASAWYVAADATIQPPIELDTLTSTPIPRLEIADPVDFSRLGSAFRAWFAVGAAPIEHRSIVRNTGTATD